MENIKQVKLGSPDYVDVDQNGPDKGDLGSWTRVNYTLVNNNYKWRTPYDPYGLSANFSEGLLSNSFDDKANYVYGEKEIWYLDKI